MRFLVRHIEETDSTNRWLSLNKVSCEENLVDDDLAEGNSLCEVVVAEYQTAGKGCGSNTWESERGKNLTFSVMLHPTGILANRQFVISEIVSVALCKALDSYIYNKVEIKWPNDIYYGDRKLCGILIENVLQSRLIKDSIIGIGLNVNQETFVSDAPNPVSLRQILGHEVDREALLQAFLHQLEETFVCDTVSEDYRSRLYRREGLYTYRDNKGEFEAKLLNVLDDGQLVLMDTSGRARMYSFKEVAFVL